jgi:hypothetical protein
VNKSVPWLYLGLGLAQAAHSIEEVLTGLWLRMPVVSGAIHTRLGFVPVVGWSATGFAVANLVIVALMLGFSPFPFLNRTWSWTVVTVVAVVETINALIHLSGALVTGEYFPGCITAVLLLGLSIPIWSRKSLRRKETA